MSRCGYCGNGWPCGCPQSRGQCPRCGGEPHVGLTQCPEERRAATARMTSRVLGRSTCASCGLDGTAELTCLHCGAMRPPASAGARHRETMSAAEANAQLEDKIAASKRAEVRSIRVGRVALELLQERRYRDAP